MALINCIECGKEISDKAVSCPNCDCPIQQQYLEPIFNYNDVEYNIESVIQLLQKGNIGVAGVTFSIALGINNKIASDLFKKVQDNFNNGKYKVRCPKCTSDNFELIPRKWGISTGFTTNKVDRVCRNCKYKF